MSKSRRANGSTPKAAKTAVTRAKQALRFTESQVAEALKASGGIYSDAARYLASKHKRPLQPRRRHQLRPEQRRARRTAVVIVSPRHLPTASATVDAPRGADIDASRLHGE
jgi:hypothetical protein